MQAIRLALTEYARSTGLFGLGPLLGVPRFRGGRDLVSLTLLCAIIIALMTFAHSAGRGVAENVTQALLGHVRGAGTPIWVVANVLRDEGLDARTLQVFGNRGGYPADARLPPPATGTEASDALRGLNFFPVTETEGGDPLIQLPLPEAWNRTATPGDSPVDFRGWALDSDNPVIKAVAGNLDSWRTVVLNKKLFAEHFNYASYRDLLRDVLPKPMTADLPEKLASVDQLKSIYLSVPYKGPRRRLVKFEVIWAETLPALQKISMLIRYEPIILARAVIENSEMNFVVEDDVDQYDKPFQLANRVSFLGTNRAQTQQLFSEGGAITGFEACIGKDVQKEARGSTILYHLRSPVPWTAITECLRRAGLQDYRDMRPGFESYPPIRFEGRYLETACASVSARVLLRATEENCEEGKGTVKFSPFPYYRSGLVFVPGGADVGAALEDVKQYGDERGKVFLIGENYQDALSRMGYTQQVIGYLTLAIAGLGLLLCASVLILQIRPLLASRASVYGLLLARGISYRWIYMGVSVQVLLSVAIGTIFAVALVYAVNYGLETAFGASGAAESARTEFGISEPRLIPLPVSDDGSPVSWVMGLVPSLSLGVALTGLLSLAFSWVTMASLPLRGTTTPVDLIVGKHHAPAAKASLPKEAAR